MCPTKRCDGGWVLKFGPLFARELRRRRPRPTSQWHLDEMAVMISCKQFWLRALIGTGPSFDQFALAWIGTGKGGEEKVPGLAVNSGVKVVMVVRLTPSQKNQTMYI
jgi:hypothetical protein